MPKRAAILFALATVIAAPAMAQPIDLPIAPATTDKYPPGVSVRRLSTGAVYTNSRGLTLYGMDMRTLLRWDPDPSKYCKEECQQTWQPMLAPANAQVNIRFPGARPRSAADPDAARFVDNRTAPDWTVIEGAQGPQWVYKGWHLVFTRKGDKPGSVAFDGDGEMTWNTLKFIPPRPALVAPPGVGTAWVKGHYVLVDAAGHALFTGHCGASCAGWNPLAAPLASRGILGWSVARAGDLSQWSYKGAPVFIDPDSDVETLPQGGSYLTP